MESYVYILIEIFICLIISNILVFYYSRRGTNPLALITAALTWGLNFILIVFLPYDIFYTYSGKEEDEVIKNLLSVGYKFLYWTLFICSWIFVPLMQEYEDSGDFTKKKKFIRSIKNNMIFYGILGVIAITFLVFGFIYWGGIDALKSVVYNLMNCSYLIGLLLFYFLIGYSIVNLPIKTFYKINYEKQIKYLEWRAISLKNNLEQIQKELVDDGYLLQSTLENFSIMKRVNKSKSYEYDEVDEKSDKSEEKSEERRNSSFSSQNIQDYSKVITERYDYLYNNANVFGINLKRNTVDNDKEPLQNVEDLIKLNRKINKNEWDDLRIQIKLRNQYKHWLTLSTVIYETNQENKKNIEITSTINDDKLLPNENNESESPDENIIEVGFCPYKDISKFTILYYQKFKRPLLIIYLSLIVICGLIFLISQIGGYFKKSLYGYILKSVINKDLGIIGLHFFIMIPIIFLFVMSIYTFFKLKISGYFYMYKNRQTDSVTLMYFSTNLCRISFSICLDLIFNIDLEFAKDKGHSQNQPRNDTNSTSNITDNITDFFIFSSNFTENITNLGNITQIQQMLDFSQDKAPLFFKIYKYSPAILAIYVLILIFRIPQKIAKLFGKKIFDAESDESINEITEGHDFYMEINKKYNGGVMPRENLKLPEDKYNK